MLNCHQGDENATVTKCNTADWADLRSCMAKLSEKDCIVLGLMLGLVGPSCEYLKTDNGVYATLLDTMEQVKESFKFNEDAEYNFAIAGQTFISQFLPLYEDQFRKTHFFIFVPWFLISYIWGSKGSCHMAVIGCFTMELGTTAVSRSFVGFLLPLMGISEHCFCLILRYITLIAQGYGCSDCYWKFISKFVLFIPQTLLYLMDFIRGYGKDELGRDNKGRFSRK